MKNISTRIARISRWAGLDPSFEQRCIICFLQNFSGEPWRRQASDMLLHSVAIAAQFQVTRWQRGVPQFHFDVADRPDPACLLRHGSCRKVMLIQRETTTVNAQTFCDLCVTINDQGCQQTSAGVIFISHEISSVIHWRMKFTKNRSDSSEIK